MKLFVVILLSLIILSVGQGASLPVRVWQLQSNDMAHIERVIKLAPEYGINEVQLTHQIVMEGDEILTHPKLVGQINSICDLAHGRHIRVSFMTHELNRVPKEFFKNGQVDLDNPGLWTWLSGKYERVFDACPNVDGIVLTFQETEVMVYDDGKVTSSLTPPQRVGKLIDTLAAVCKSHGKQLTVRDFCYEPSQQEFIRQGFALAKSDFIVMTKCQPHDWQPYYPNNSLIGSVGGRPQIVEFDSGQEFLGQSSIPYIDTDYVKHRLDYAVPRGIIGGVIRIERYGHYALDTPNWADVDVLSKLLQNPSANPDALLKSHLTKRYGNAAAPKLMPAFKRTFDIVNKSLFVLGFWASDHSHIPSYGYALKHLESNGTDKWDPDPKWSRIHAQLRKPDMQMLKQIADEKSQALAECRKSMREVELAKDSLSATDYEELTKYFKREEAVVLAWSAYFDAFFSCRAYETSGKVEYKVLTEKAVARLLDVAKNHGSELMKTLGDDNLDNVQRMNSFAKEIRKRLDKIASKNPSNIRHNGNPEARNI